jgi:hypothetical protein
MSDGDNARRLRCTETSAATLRIGPAADQLRVPAAAAGRDGAIPRPKPAAAEAAAPLALVQAQRPGRLRAGCGSGCRGGAARTPEGDA